MNRYLHTSFQSTADAALSSPGLAVVGRVRTALEKPEMGTLPASCTTHMPTFTNEGVAFLIRFISKALRTGAGVNIHLDNFVESPRPSGSSQLAFVTSLEEAAYKFPPGPSYYYAASDSMEETDQKWDHKQGKSVPTIQLPYKPGDYDALPLDACIYQCFVAGRAGHQVAINIAGLRPQGVKNAQGMVSSGPDSFKFLMTKAFEFGRLQTVENLLAFLSAFNQELRRGGTYKNGALTTSMPAWSPCAKAYLETPKERHPWLKKGMVVSADIDAYDHLIELMISKVNDGSLWLEKAIAQTDGGLEFLPSYSHLIHERLLSNVCREVLLKDRGTCDLTHVNAGQCLSPRDLVANFELGMHFLCKLKRLNLAAEASIYRDVDSDNQVGLGVLGLANQLAILGFTYEEFVANLGEALNDYYQGNLDYWDMSSLQKFRNPRQLAWAYIWCYAQASLIAKQYAMARAFVIAPTANSSFRHQDAEGFTTSPEISPPVNLSVERVSETYEDPDFFDYHPNSETASEVGWELQKRLITAWQELMEIERKAHTISFNIWEDFDNESFLEFLYGRPWTTYYRLDVEDNFLDKADPMQNSGIQCACLG